MYYTVQSPCSEVCTFSFSPMLFRFDRLNKAQRTATEQVQSSFTFLFLCFTSSSVGHNVQTCLTDVYSKQSFQLSLIATFNPLHHPEHDPMYPLPLPYSRLLPGPTSLTSALCPSPSANQQPPLRPPANPHSALPPIRGRQPTTVSSICFASNLKACRSPFLNLSLTLPKYEKTLTKSIYTKTRARIPNISRVRVLIQDQILPVHIMVFIMI